MSLIKFSKSILFFSLLLSSAAFSGTFTYDLIPGTTSTSSTDNRVYAGLKWTLNEGVKPQAVVGFRHARTQSDGNTNGGDISISAKIIDDFELGKLRAKYFDGKEKVQGEVGGGFDFTRGLFAGVGLHAPYSLIGLDIHPFINENKLEPYFQIDTIKKYKKNNSPTNICVISDNYGSWQDSDCTVPSQPSDRRLKHSIQLLARLHNGMKIYAFKYLWSDVIYVGVMAQDLLQNPAWKKAVVTNENGFYGVNYRILGLKMTTLSQWKKDGFASITAKENFME